MVCKEIETNVIVAKINACMAPTKISRNKNGNGIKYGARKEIIVSKTSPAKTFPNNRKDKEIIFANSEISSKIPIKKSIGPLKLKYFPKCLKTPTDAIPIIFVTITEITANAKVKFRSAAGERKSGTLSLPLLNINEPTPGNIPKRFEVNIKIKIVATSGKYFSAAFMLPKVDSISPKSISKPISTAPCNLPGTSLILLLITRAKIIKTKQTTNVKKKLFVTPKFPILNMCSAFNEISSIMRVNNK